MKYLLGLLAIISIGYIIRQGFIQDETHKLQKEKLRLEIHLLKMDSTIFKNQKFYE